MGTAWMEAEREKAGFFRKRKWETLAKNLQPVTKERKCWFASQGM